MVARATTTTTARGYGAAHQSLRKQKLAVLVDGTPCRRCGHPRYHPARCAYGPCWRCRLDLGHHTPLALSQRNVQGPRELEHVRCNRGAGARLGNRLRRRRQHTRAW